MAVAFQKKQQVAAGFVSANGDGERFHCVTSHSVVETADGTLGIIEQVAASGFPHPVELGTAGRLLLESGQTPDVVEFACSLIGLSEVAEIRSSVVRLFVFGDDTPECRGQANRIALEWIANRMKANDLRRVLNDLREASHEAKRTLDELRAGRRPVANEIFAGPRNPDGSWASPWKPHFSPLREAAIDRSGLAHDWDDN